MEWSRVDSVVCSEFESDKLSMSYGDFKFLHVSLNLRLETVMLRFVPMLMLDPIQWPVERHKSSLQCTKPFRRNYAIFNFWLGYRKKLLVSLNFRFEIENIRFSPMLIWDPIQWPSDIHKCSLRGLVLFCSSSSIFMFGFWIPISHLHILNKISSD